MQQERYRIWDEAGDCVVPPRWTWNSLRAASGWAGCKCPLGSVMLGCSRAVFPSCLWRFWFGAHSHRAELASQSRWNFPVWQELQPPSWHRLPALSPYLCCLCFWWTGTNSIFSSLGSLFPREKAQTLWYWFEGKWAQGKHLWFKWWVFGAGQICGAWW